jgi:enoyl-CoA hydratase/carnithine racemase
MPTRRRFIQNLAAIGVVAGAAGAVAASAAQENTQPDNDASRYDKYSTMKVTLNGPVANLLVSNVLSLPKPGERPPNLHWELGEIFSEMRSDNRIRVIVMTGPGNGNFHAGKRNRYAENPAPRDQENEWLNFAGLRRFHEETASSEKILVAKVNGDAIGFGQSLVFAADIIVAQEDALIADFHLGMGEIGDYGPPFGVVPGDGGCALIPLFMPPALAKEYLLLGRQFRAAELARLGIINYAVPASRLDATVDGLVERLLKRPAYGLAWAKRIANRRVVNHLNLTLDAAAAYEQLHLMQTEKLGWKDQLNFL